MFFPISEWVRAFGLTLAVEAPIAWLLLRPAISDAVRFAVLFTTVNLATHLGVWYVLTQLFLIGTFEYAVAAEGWAITAEAVFYAAAFPAITARRAFAVATAANLTSFLVGRIVVELRPDLLI
jgi:hypothetical protein